MSRKKKGQRLKELGISEEQLKKYLEVFTSRRDKYRHIIKKDEGWITIKHKWSDNHILRHLLNEIIIGLFPTDKVNYLIFDIDNHGKESISAEERANKILSALDVKPIVCRSSKSNGYHIYVSLDKDYYLEDIKSFAETFLSSCGLMRKNGFVEVSSDHKGFRLPFGEGSVLLSPDNLQKISTTSISEIIDYCYKIYNSNRLQIPETKIDDTDDIPDSHMEIVNKLYNDGLYEDISTNDALLKLSWDRQTRNGNSPEETINLLKSWIRINHNGCSDRYNNGKLDDIDKQIERIVNSYDPSKVIKRYSLNRTSHGLPDEVADFILSSFQTYKNQQVLFNLYLYILNNGKLVQNDVKNLKNLNNSYRESFKKLFSSNYNSTKYQLYSCEIPVKAMIKMPGFDRKNPANTVSYLIENGLLSIYKNAHPASHKCRTFLALIPKYTNKSRIFVSLDEAILNLLSPIQINKYYTDYRIRFLRKLK